MKTAHPLVPATTTKVTLTDKGASDLKSARIAKLGCDACLTSSLRAYKKNLQGMPVDAFKVHQLYGKVTNPAEILRQIGLKPGRTELLQKIEHIER